MEAEQVELQPVSNEYLSALRPVRRAKTVAWLAVWVALAIQVVCFVLVRFTGLLEVSAEAAVAAPAGARTEAATQPEAAPSPAAAAASSPATTRPAASSPATGPGAAEAPAARAPAGNDPYTVQLRRQTLGWLLAGTKFLGPAAALALVVLLLGAAQISLTGRLGGAGGFVSAFVWSVFLLLLLTPWQQFLGGWLRGTLTSFEELQWAITGVQREWSAGQYLSAPVLCHLAVFLLYPFVALLVWGLVGLRFARGMRAVNLSTSVAPPASK